MKKITVLFALILLVSVTFAFAQTTPPPAAPPGFNFGVALGVDTAWLSSPGKVKGFTAVGLGMDVAGYTKALSPTGSTLALFLHLTALTPDAAVGKAPITGLSINCDLLQLVTGSNVKIMIPQLRVIGGPMIAYDSARGVPLIGVMANLNYAF